jgi:uncharacterized protein YqhQ
MSRVSIGGQAVMEGVMMKNNDRYAIAVRKPDKEIDVSVTKFVPVGEKNRIFKVPIIRGVFNFVESMVIGIKTLMYSASFFEDEEEEKKTKEKTGKKNEKEMSDSAYIFWTVAFSLVIAIGIFGVIDRRIYKKSYRIGNH